MEFTFAEALQLIGRNAQFEIANSARPPASFLFNQLLPERNEIEYNVDAGNMIVRSTMAGPVGMDSTYPLTGFVEASAFQEKTIKLANEVPLSEAALRRIQLMVQRLLASGTSANETVVREALNFYSKVIIQGQLDVMEWLRGQALTTGAIDFTFNGKRIQVDYGIPSAHKFSTRTKASNEAYGGSSSKFWADVREARRLLRGDIQVAIAHSSTVDEIVSNDANKLVLLEQRDADGNATGAYTVQKYVGSTERLSSDARDRLRIVIYDLEAEILDPANNTTKAIPFMAPGTILFVGQNRQIGYRPGDGSTPNPENTLSLGYTHLAPTVESGGAPGRWGELYVPQHEPYTLRGRAASNGLPVIEAPKKIVLASTEFQD